MVGNTDSNKAAMRILHSGSMERWGLGGGGGERKKNQIVLHPRLYYLERFTLNVPSLYPGLFDPTHRENL